MDSESNPSPSKIFKIWLLLDSRGFGGIESHVEQLATGLSRFSCEEHTTHIVVVFLQDYGTHPSYERLSSLGIHYRVLDGRPSTLWRAIKHDRPDVIHTHGYKAGLLARPMCKLLNTRCVSTFHSGEAKQGKLRLYDWLDRHTAFLSDTVFAVSPKILATLPCRAHIADNFINLDGVTRSHGQQIAFVGRLSHEKAPDRFIDIAAQLPDTQFHLYGDGPLRQTLENRAPNNVTFHGQQADMEQVWAEIGLLVMPSRAEGLPMAALEAMARGIPVIAASVGALPQLIEHQKNGWLIESEDGSAYLNAVQSWQHIDLNERHQLQQNAINTIKKRYSAQVVIPNLLRLYTQTDSYPQAESN